MPRDHHGCLLATCLIAGFCLAEEPDIDTPRESSVTQEVIDGKASFYIKPLEVQAGSYPNFSGEVFRPYPERYPGYLNLPDRESRDAARKLSEVDGLHRRVSSFFPGGWDPLNGVPLAFLTKDLQAAGYTGTKEDAGIGLLDIFRIKLSTPEHKSTFPNRLVLHIQFQKGERETTLPVDMDLYERDGVYGLADRFKVHNEIASIAKSYFGIRKGFTDFPTSMRLTKLTGFDPELGIEDLPPIKGAMLLHHVYLGSYRVVSGWQWIGRPPGLWGSLQRGFVQ